MVNPAKIKNKKKIGIIGYGRFGQLMVNILKKDFEVLFYDNNHCYQHHDQFRPLSEIIKLAVVILAVPIGQMESLLKQIAPKITTQLVMDVCSVKIYPTKWMMQYLPENISIIATHPLFGPDSYDQSHEKNMVMFPARIEDNLFQDWYGYFKMKKINIQIMSPDDHDLESSLSQHLTHYIGRILSQMDFKKGKITTIGYNNLLKIIDQTCNDSWELFVDMLKYNPYSQQMITRFDQAKDTLVKALKEATNMNHHFNHKVLTHGK